MTAHPLSLRKQICLLFPEVEKVRLESFGPFRTVFHVKLPAGLENQAALQARIQEYLAEHRVLGSVALLATNYQDGSLWPQEYDAFTLADLDIIEACRMNQDGLAASLPQVFPNIISVEFNSRRPLSLTLITKAAIDQQHVELFIQACLNNFELPVLIEAKIRSPSTGSSLPNSLSQLLDEDQSLYRDFCAGYFRTTRRALNQRFEQRRFATYKHGKNDGDDVRPLLPFYDQIFFQASEMAKALDGEGKFWGMTREESLALVEKEVLIPVLFRPLRPTDDHLSSIAQLIEASPGPVLPWELAESTAVRLLADAPLWALAQSDASLASHALRAIEDEFRESAGQDSSVQTLLRRIIRHTRRGCVDFRSHLIAHPFQLSSTIGLTSLFFDTGENDTNLEAAFASLEIELAAALGASFLPPRRLLPWCNLLSAVREGAPAGLIEQLASSESLETVMADLELAIPQDMPVVEWKALLDDVGVNQIRHTVCEIFTGMVEARDHAAVATFVADAKRELEKIQKEVATAVRRRKTAKIMITLDVLGETIAYLTGANIPFLTTGISMFAALFAPKIGDKVLANAVLRETASHIEAFTLRTSVRATRLLHLRDQLTRRRASP